MTTLERVRALCIEDYNYPLPDERIAKHPLARRETCKLLCYDGHEPTTHRFDEVPALLPQGAMLVYNNTRVINARLRFTKPTGGTIEIFCLEPIAPHDYQLTFQTTDTCSWLCLVGNNKRWKQGPLSLDVKLPQGIVTLHAERGQQRGNAFEITFSWQGGYTWATLLEAVGEIPIPPYLNRGTEPSDATDYQTVYSHIDGSVAAPTAGLHFTDDVLARCDSMGIARRELTLHVGAGTFQPVKSEVIGDHAMHREFIEVPRDLLVELAAGERPVVAVGTTSVRTLESLYYIGVLLHDNPEAGPEELTVTQWMPYTTAATITMRDALRHIIDHLDRTGANRYVGATELMIAPGFRFGLVDAMITNFHQPQSTLLLLVSAFLGGDRWRDVYRYALDNGYRFLSYGDACLFTK